MTIRVIVNGAKGRMGLQSVQAVKEDAELVLVGEADLGDDLAKMIGETEARVVVDFTHPDAVFSNAWVIIDAGAHPVIGTTGLEEDQMETLREKCSQKGLGGLIAPNFAIGAVLMMRFSAEAARYFPHVEIIELHHDRKADAPSGTAIKTAQMIRAARPQPPEPKVVEKELSPGARGAKDYGMPIHSVRLPGHVAHQEVILGGVGESLKIRHDSINRECFMPGVIMAVKKVTALKELFYGLETIL